MAALSRWAHSGQPVFPFNSQGMRRAWIDENGDVQAAV